MLTLCSCKFVLKDSCGSTCQSLVLPKQQPLMRTLHTSTHTLLSHMLLLLLLLLTDDDTVHTQQCKHGAVREVCNRRRPLAITSAAKAHTTRPGARIFFGFFLSVLRQSLQCSVVSYTVHVCVSMAIGVYSTAICMTDDHSTAIYYSATQSATGARAHLALEIYVRALAATMSSSAHLNVKIQPVKC
jgi:hypothetical protein